MNAVESQNTISKVIVPVSNPDTAKDLLGLACALSHPEEGEVTALFILGSDFEEDSKTLDQLESLIESLQAQGYPVELQTHKSSNVARGILDTARDNGSDLIILGVQYSNHGQVVLGTIGENVLAAVSCPVVIYRPARNEQTFQRVLIPTDGSLPAQTACVVGLKLSQYYQIEAEAVYVQSRYHSRWEGLGRIEQSLEGISGSGNVKRTLITALDPVQGILARLNDDDLLIVGYQARSNFERWLFGDFSRQMLENSHCAAVLVSPTVPMIPFWSLARKSVNRFVLRLTPAEQEDIARQAFDLSSASLDYLVLIAIAALLASLGLLANSVAVIIGAMLVAPFMQPCIAFAVGMTTGQLALARRAIFTLLVGIPIAVGIAGLTGLLAQGRPFTPEMLARGNPTALDVLVAFGSGVMGAYATARKEIPSALAGVAIAAALMPPLCTFGLGLTGGNLDLGLHAGLLFLTNIVCIALAAWVVFLWMGLRPELNPPVRHFNYGSIITFVALVLLTIGLLIDFTITTSHSQQIVQWLEDAFKPGQVSDVEVKGGLPVRVTLVVRSVKPVTVEQVTAAEQLMETKLSSPVHLDVIYQQQISSP